ncbi:hypothetical protein V5799_020342, partial [Amblyomma americanum]
MGCPYFGGLHRRPFSQGAVEHDGPYDYSENANRKTRGSLDSRVGAPTEAPSGANVSFRETTNVATRCAAPTAKRACDPAKPYSEWDGSCNNLDHPDWGESYACLRRLLEPAYGEGAGKIRLAKSGRALPSPRLISARIHTHEGSTPDQRRTHMLMAFGQFFAHDVSLTPNRPLSRIEINQGIDMTTGALPIDVPDNDPFYGPFNHTKIDFQRSVPCSRCRS